jgi:hypothetical protein
MTSRRPGAEPTPGTADTLSAGLRQAPAQRLLVRVLPLILLIILGLVGLRGAVTAPRWNGPLHRDGLAIGGALEVVFGVLLVITIRRRRAGRTAALINLMVNAPPVNAVAVKLRGVLIFLLGAGMVAVAVIVLVGLHLNIFTGHLNKIHPQPAVTRTRSLPPATSQNYSGSHTTVVALLYALLIVVLIAGVVLSIWWARRLRPPGGPRDDYIAEDPQDLREAVEAGRSALRTLDDARAAIIACYVAMETHLAERGAARAVADTPDELLARATSNGVVRGTAAARLTALFYEARFSSHPLDRSQRDAAEQALDELAAALSDAEAADAEAAGLGT